MIALAKGIFTEAIELSKPITLWGACAAETKLDAPAGSGAIDPNDPSTVPAAIRVGAGVDAAVRNLSIGGARTGLLVRGQS